MITLRHYSHNLKIFHIQSSTRPPIYHTITINRHKIYCSCEDFQLRQCKLNFHKIEQKDSCKHIKELSSRNIGVSSKCLYSLEF